MKRYIAAFALFGACISVTARTAERSRTFECTFEPPIGTSLVDGEFSRKPVLFKDMTTPWVYHFTLGSSKPVGKPIDVAIQSDTDFATIGGTYEALSVAPETYLINALKVGNCMFSSQICGATIQLTDLDSENAAAAITPISYFGGQKDARFFHVVLMGKCTNLIQSGGNK